MKTQVDITQRKKKVNNQQKSSKNLCKEYPWL